MFGGKTKGEPTIIVRLTTSLCGQLVGKKGFIRDWGLQTGSFVRLRAEVAQRFIERGYAVEVDQRIGELDGTVRIEEAVNLLT
ncbi:MAG: hypothetical protein JNM56_16450 [Planctomycetia bacterium]|nr:hypothetical protein [Planctomycetia bacterium]